MNQMTRRVACATGTAAMIAAMARPAWALPTDSDLRKLLEQRLALLGGADGGGGLVGAMVGAGSPRVAAVGRLAKGHARAVDGDTVFEIGSVTKVFTALLLASMVAAKEVALDDPVERLLRPGTKIPERNGRKITLFDLATHTSGLPFMPDALPDSAATDTATGLYRLLAGYQLTRDPGSSWDYSNLGYWLLGEALAFRAGASFKSALHSRVIAPLGLTSTAFEASSAMKARLASGHDASLERARSFAEMPVYADMPAAGGLLSTANDMARFLSLAMKGEEGPLASAVSLSLKARRPGGRAEVLQALGWSIVRDGEETLYFRDGGTLGYASCIVWHEAKREGAVVLSNQVASVSDLARRLVQPAFPLEAPSITKARTEISLSVAALDRYAGRYEAAGEGVFIVVREDTFLTFEAPGEWGLPKLRLRPETAQDFFVSELPLLVKFESDAGGRVTGMLITPPRGQKAIPAKRL
jgi:D-alanyl-D-alanine-carboxypeptidase/D-alanyl-D-alanine-endopeptidase